MVYGNIKKFCTEKNISIKDLEKKAGLSNGSIGKWNKDGANPGIKSVEAVAKALGVNVSDLTGVM